MGSESFVLKWNEFACNVTSNLADLRREDADFCDVTVAIDETKQIRAHKVILASASQYFGSVLRQNLQHPNPVLILPPNIRFRDLCSLMDYIYKGEVTVFNEDLNSLLSLARHLKVKGLVDADGKAQSQQPQVQPQAVKRPQPPPHIDDDHGEGRVGDSKKKKISDANPVPSTSTRFLALQCPDCPQRLPGVDAFRAHMAQMHGKGDSAAEVEQPVVCEFCNKRLKNEKTLQAHKKRLHEQQDQQLLHDASPAHPGVGMGMGRGRGQGRGRGGKKKITPHRPLPEMAMPMGRGRGQLPQHQPPPPPPPPHLQPPAPPGWPSTSSGRGHDIKRSLGLKLGGQISITSEQRSAVQVKQEPFEAAEAEYEEEEYEYAEEEPEHYVESSGYEMYDYEEYEEEYQDQQQQQPPPQPQHPQQQQQPEPGGSGSEYHEDDGVTSSSSQQLQKPQ